MTLLAKAGVAAPFALALLWWESTNSSPLVNADALGEWSVKYGFPIALIMVGGLFFVVSYWPYYKKIKDREMEADTTTAQHERDRVDRLTTILEKAIDAGAESNKRLADFANTGLNDVKSEIAKLYARHKQLNDFIFRHEKEVIPNNDSQT